MYACVCMHVCMCTYYFTITLFYLLIRTVSLHLFPLESKDIFTLNIGPYTQSHRECTQLSPTCQAAHLWLRVLNYIPIILFLLPVPRRRKRKRRKGRGRGSESLKEDHIETWRRGGGDNEEKEEGMGLFGKGEQEGRGIRERIRERRKEMLRNRKTRNKWKQRRRNQKKRREREETGGKEEKITEEKIRKSL